MRDRNVRETETRAPCLSLRFFPSSTHNAPPAVHARLTASGKPLPPVDKRDLVECNCACK